MPEHDLLMQLNKDMKYVCSSMSRIEQQVTDLNDSFKLHCTQCDTTLLKHDERISTLEDNDKKRVGIAIGVSTVFSFLATIIMTYAGVI